MRLDLLKLLSSKVLLVGINPLHFTWVCLLFSRSSLSQSSVCHCFVWWWWCTLFFTPIKIHLFLYKNTRKEHLYTFGFGKISLTLIWITLHNINHVQRSWDIIATYCIIMFNSFWCYEGFQVIGVYFHPFVYSINLCFNSNVIRSCMFDYFCSFNQWWRQFDLV